jgi:hypothetical protein
MRGYGEDKRADVFLLAPTVSMGDAPYYNMSLDDAASRENFTAAVKMQMGLYDGQCRVYAPYYREAAYAVYSLPEEQQVDYFSIAYEDVSAAFSWYLKNCNNGRPIILAGYSQGADMVQRLIKEYFSDSQLRSQLVAAYAIGWAITQEDVDEWPWLVMAQGEDDVGVVISFECEAEGLTQSRIVEDGIKMLSINPLNWQTDSSYAPASENLGACFVGRDGSIYAETAGLTGAYIDADRGTLICPDVTPEEYPAMQQSFRPGEYHYYDYQFFYRNIQDNVALRIEAWYRQSRTLALL